MKRGTPNHPKMADLAAKLELPIYAAVGLMEMLWHFADEYAIQGDIGKHSDCAIARAVGWTKDPGTLIAALVECRWLDQCDERRYLVHDWEDHCNDYCSKRLKRAGLTVYKVSGKIQTIPEKSGLARGVAGLGEVEAKGESGKVQTIPEKSGQKTVAVIGMDQFEKWWAVWSGTRGTNHKQQAVHAWMSVVNGSNESACIECTASYIASLDDPARGYNPENFLFEQSPDGFQARWPPAKIKQNHKNGSAPLEYRRLPGAVTSAEFQRLKAERDRRISE